MLSQTKPWKFQEVAASGLSVEAKLAAWEFRIFLPGSKKNYVLSGVTDECKLPSSLTLPKIIEAVQTMRIFNQKKVKSASALGSSWGLMASFNLSYL